MGGQLHTRLEGSLTQGESLVELDEYLRDLYRDLTYGEIPGVGKSPNYP